MMMTPALQITGIREERERSEGVDRLAFKCCNTRVQRSRSSLDKGKGKGKGNENENESESKLQDRQTIVPRRSFGDADWET